MFGTLLLCTEWLLLWINTCLDLLGLSGADQAVLKEAHASLMTLALEAAKTDSDSANIRYTYSMRVGMSKCKLSVALPHYSPGAVLF